jgi:hypothetical protein
MAEQNAPARKLPSMQARQPYDGAGSIRIAIVDDGDWEAEYAL